MFKPYKIKMYISLTEAATLLGVNKETLRNWDKSGKLYSHRDPANNYRYYKLADVQALLKITSTEISGLLKKEMRHKDGAIKDTSSQNFSDGDFKRALIRVHKVLRDIDGSSSLVERFDEVTKLIFLKLLSEKSSNNIFKKQEDETDTSYAKRLRKIFLEKSNKSINLFPNKFKKINLSDKALSQAALIFSGVDLGVSNHDIKGHAYEEMIKNTFDKGDHQQFFTPYSIVEFLVSMLESDIQGMVCDPAAGTGGFLVEILKQNLSIKKLIGLEIDERLAWVSGINLQVHGAVDFDTRYLPDGGSLGVGGIEFKNTIDLIITNPPFGSDFSGKDLNDYTLGKGRVSRRRGVLFIERCLEMLKPGGVMGIVIDEGVLSLPTNEDVRRLLLDRAELLAVVGMPDSAFMPYASVATSILVLRKLKGVRSTVKTFFAKADNIGRKPNGDPDINYDEAGMPILNSDLPNILNEWRRYKSGKKIIQSEAVYLAEVDFKNNSSKQNSYRMDFRYHHPSRLAADLALKDSKKIFLKLSQLCDVRNESFVPSIDFSDQVIPYTGLAQIESRVGRAQQIMVSGNSLKSAVKKYEYGDILFAKMRPSLRKVVYIDFPESGYASAECVVLVVKNDESGNPVINPHLLSILLRSNFVYGQIIHLTAGIGRPRISLKDLLNIKIPLIDEKKQVKLLSEFNKKRHAYETRKADARRLAEDAAASELEAIEDVGVQFMGN